MPGSVSSTRLLAVRAARQGARTFSTAIAAIRQIASSGGPRRTVRGGRTLHRLTVPGEPGRSAMATERATRAGPRTPQPWQKLAPESFTADVPTDAHGREVACRSGALPSPAAPSFGRAYVPVVVVDTGWSDSLANRSRLVPGRERPVRAVSAYLARSGSSVPGLWVTVELICDRGRMGAPDCRQLWNLPRPDTSR
jgi:hypothetical protein